MLVARFGGGFLVLKPKFGDNPPPYCRPPPNCRTLQTIPAKAGIFLSNCRTPPDHSCGSRNLSAELSHTPDHSCGSRNLSAELPHTARPFLRKQESLCQIVAHSRPFPRKQESLCRIIAHSRPFLRRQESLRRIVAPRQTIPAKAGISRAIALRRQFGGQQQCQIRTQITVPHQTIPA